MVFILRTFLCICSSASYLHAAALSNRQLVPALHTTAAVLPYRISSPLRTHCNNHYTNIRCNGIVIRAVMCRWTPKFDCLQDAFKDQDMEEMFRSAGANAFNNQVQKQSAVCCKLQHSDVKCFEIISKNRWVLQLNSMCRTSGIWVGVSRGMAMMTFSSTSISTWVISVVLATWVISIWQIWWRVPSGTVHSPLVNWQM